MSDMNVIDGSIADSIADRFLRDRDPVELACVQKGFPTLIRPVCMFTQSHGSHGLHGSYGQLWSHSSSHGSQRTLSHGSRGQSRSHHGRPVPNGLEVVLATATRKPTGRELLASWKARRQGRASPVMLIVAYETFDSDPLPLEGISTLRGGDTLERVRMSICGPTGDKPPVWHDVEVSQAERLADVALSEPSHHAATRFLLANLPQLDFPIPGLRNVGLLATQELKDGVPNRSDWSSSCKRGSRLTRLRGRQLVESLGFNVKSFSTHTSMLTAGGEDRAVAVFCDEDEPFDTPAPRFNGTSPVSQALAVAYRHQVDWVILTRASEIRLYASRDDTGVGRRGRAETFVELNLALLPDNLAGYLHLLFSVDALQPDGTLEAILGESSRFASALAERLRERVYFETVPALANAIARRLSSTCSNTTSAAPTDTSPTSDSTVVDLENAYEQVMLILFRLLFVAYAEDKDLLPYRTNSNYQEHSLKQIACRLVERRDTGDRGGASRSDDASHNDSGDTVRSDDISNADASNADNGGSTSLWDAVCKIWRAVSAGNPDWSVPTYNGGLFSENPKVSPAGAALADLNLTDAEFAPALKGLLIDTGYEGDGPVDFRSLSVREFGTIYEGLLESRLAVAQQDLVVRVVKGQEHYVPANSVSSDTADSVPSANRLAVGLANKSVAVAGAVDVSAGQVSEGQVYMHNRSGVRKATGSYFTKPFAVEHLLDHALKPALDDHIARLDAFHKEGDDARLAEAFFDFRCADIAMGSGHFLVAALDRIEARLSAWLTQHPVAAITAELQRLHRTAEKALGDLADGVDIEFGSLLRRQVARHCVYGVDRNRIAVELARLAIWVHTFVPGLPLSLLDHNLVHGDSLTGIGTLDEVEAALEPDRKLDAPSLKRQQIEEMLQKATVGLKRLALVSDATKREIDESRAAYRDVQSAVAGARAVFDVITAHRAGDCALPENLEANTIIRIAQRDAVTNAIRTLKPIHFPTAFPEVFLRDRPGFDCLLGNPPWEQVIVAEDQWWGVYMPGVRSLPVNKMNDAIRYLRKVRPDLEQEFQQELKDTDVMRAVLREVFPSLGSGHTDLYKAFCWRNWHLVRTATGSVGLVLPRSVLQTKGSEHWRKTVFQEGTFSDVTVLLNTKGWVFNDVHGQFTVAMCALRKTGTSAYPADVRFIGPYTSKASYLAGRKIATESVPTAEFMSWSDDASFPQLPNHPGAVRLFRKLRAHPRLDATFATTSETTDATSASTVSADLNNGGGGAKASLFQATAGRSQLYNGQAQVHSRRWRFRPIAELHATFDKPSFILDEGRSAHTESSTPQRTSTGSLSTQARKPQAEQNANYD